MCCWIDTLTVCIVYTSYSTGASPTIVTTMYLHTSTQGTMPTAYQLKQSTAHLLTNNTHTKLQATPAVPAITKFVCLKSVFTFSDTIVMFIVW